MNHTNRAIASALSLITLARVSACQDKNVISGFERQPSGVAVMPGGVMSPSDGLTVKPNYDAISTWTGKSGGAVNLSEKINSLTTLGTLAEKAQDALKVLEATPGQASINQVGQAYAEFLRVLRANADLQKRVDTLVNARGLGDIRLRTQYALQATTDLARQDLASLKASVPVVQLRIALARDPDQSRIPDAQFGVFPSQATRDAAKAVLKTLQDASGNVTPASALKGVATKYKADVERLIEDSKISARALFEKYEAKSVEFENSLTAAQKLTWDTEHKKILDLVDQAKVLSADAASAVTSLNDLVASPDETHLRVTAGLISDLVGSAKALQAKATSIAGSVDAFMRPLAGEPKRIGDEIRALITSAATDAKALMESKLKDAEAILLTFAATYNLITVREELEAYLLTVTGGEVMLPNNGGKLGEMKTALQSYDELRFSISAQKEGESEFKPIGTSASLYVWKPNHLDTITAVGFYQGANNKWSGTPIYGQVFKSGNMKKSFRENSLMPGFGLSVLTLDKDGNDQREIGVGLLVSLFNDVVLGGYSYNLSGKGGAWYLGYRVRL